MLGVWGTGFGVWCLVFGVWGLGFGVWGLVVRHSTTHQGFRVSGLPAATNRECEEHEVETVSFHTRVCHDPLDPGDVRPLPLLESYFCTWLRGHKCVSLHHNLFSGRCICVLVAVCVLGFCLKCSL